MVTHQTPHQVKSSAQFHPVLVTFAISHGKQFNVAIGVIFIPMFVYRFSNMLHTVKTRLDALFQLSVPAKFICPVTAFVPLTYNVSTLFPLLKFIPVV